MTTGILMKLEEMSIMELDAYLNVCLRLNEIFAREISMNQLTADTPQNQRFKQLNVALGLLRNECENRMIGLLDNGNGGKGKKVSK